MEEMMVTKAVPIRNRSKIDQFIIVGGERIELKAFHTKVVAPHLADAFTNECSPHVVREEGGIDQFQDAGAGAGVQPGQEYTWLMNATGNPDSPEELEFKRHTKDGPTIVSVKNPKHDPLIVRQELGGGQVPARTRGEDTVLNLGKTEVTIWPYSRKAFDKPIADWLLRRDGQQGETMRGCVKEAREPTGHEPNDTWDLDDLQLYAKMLGIERVGAKMSTLKKTAKTKSRSLEELVDETKTELLKRLFFRVADKEYPLPSYDKWLSYKDGAKRRPQEADAA